MTRFSRHTTDEENDLFDELSNLADSNQEGIETKIAEFHSKSGRSNDEIDVSMDVDPDCWGIRLA